MPPMLEPDQSAERWGSHVAAYETVFEPFTLALAEPAFSRLNLLPGARVLDVAAGPGAAALAIARRGYNVTAIDAAAGMVARIAERATEAGLPIEAHVMDAGRLGFADNTFDAAISTFGIVLVPDATAALAEMARVVGTGGPVVVVTWTEPERYELAATLIAALDAVVPERPRPPLPAQLRFRERDAFAGLFEAAGLPRPEIETVEASLEAPSARWLAANLSFAPGMAAMLSGHGERRDEVLAAFISVLENRFGNGPVSLSGRAFIGHSYVR